MSHREIEREPKIVEKRSGGWLGKILSLVIGIVLGIVLTVGGVFGAGYLILNKWSVNETVGKVNGVAGTDINVNEFLNKEYGDKTVLALLSDVTAVASELSSGEGTFATLDKISPKVGAAMGTLAENFVKYGSDFTAEEIKFNLLNTPIKDFGGYLSGDLINSIILGEMLLSTGSFSYETLTDDPLMMVLFYGVEGEDYVLDSENKKIVMLGESKPLSIGNLRTDGITDTFSDIPLTSLGFDDGGDAMMQALLYGPSNRYDVVGDDVQMKQVTYTFKGAGSSFACFDIDGEEVEAVVSPTAYGYMLSFESGKTQYVKLGTDGNYYAYKDEALQTPVRYQSTTIGDLQNNADGILNGIELAGALGVNETSNPILISLAYGVEGEDFYYDTSGKIQMFEGKSPMTIGDLKGDSLNNVISDLAIDALVEVKTDDAMLCALAYGSTNRYTVTAGKVKMNQIAYTFDEAKFYDDKNAELELVGAPEVLPSGAVKISFVNKDEETETQYLKSTDGVNFLAYADEAATVPALYKKNTVGDLQDNPDELLNTIELASALNINEESSPILITLAYGLEGEDFYYDTEDKIQMYEGKYPKTIGDLKNGSMDDTVNNIPLDTLIKFDVEEDKMLAALAYGSSDRYTVDEDGNVTMNQVLYTQNEGKFYDIGGNEVTATATATGVGYTLTFESGSEYIEQDTDGNYYAYEDETKAKEILYQKNTIGDLQTNPNAILNSIQIADVMNVTPASDRLLLSLAYGNGYKIVGEGENAEIQIINGAKPRTIYDLQTDSDAIFKGLYIADALNVTKESHPVLIALAYGEEGVNFDYDGDEIKMRDGHFPKSLQDLSGSKSENLINDLTLEAALGVTKDSDSLMKGLAFGQEGVHYTVNETSGKIEMKQIWYTFDGATLKDVNGYEISYTQNGETLQIEVDGTAQYLKAESADSNVYLAYDNENNALYYKKATLGALSDNPDSLLNNITVADAMGIESYENEQDALKKAIAFDSQGNPYTIGQLSNDPNMIIFSIHLDTVIEADSNDPLIMYLLYGKDGIHYTIQDAEVEGRSREIEVEEDGVIKTKYVVMSQQMVAVHEGNHLHNEYGEALYEQPNVLYHVTPLTDSDYDYSYVRDGVTYFLKEYVKDDEPQQIRIVDNHANENIHLYAPAYLVFVQDENGIINPVYYEHNSLDSMAGEDASLISNLTTRLTLEELLIDVDMESNFILKHLSHTVISELPHSIETLTIAQVFEDDVYETDTNGNRVLKGTWKYLLEDTTPNKDDNGNFIIKDGEYVYTAADEYTLLQMSELMENMTGNVTKASLFELKADKLITSLDQDTLENPISDILKNKTIPVKNADGTTTNKTIEELGYNYLGDFTVEHLLAFVAVLMTNPLG